MMMVMIYLRVNMPDSLNSMIRAIEHKFGRSPIHQDEEGADVLGSTFEWLGRGDIGPTDGGLPVPYKSPSGPGDFWVWKVTMECWEDLLTLANPSDILLGGVKIIGVVDEDDNTVHGSPPEPREVVFG